MKKQTEILTTTATRPAAKKLELIFLVVIATVIYRNRSNRAVPSGMPPNTLSQLVGKLANFFYNVTGESLYTLLRFLAIAGIIVFVAAAIVYIIRTH